VEASASKSPKKNQGWDRGHGRKPDIVSSAYGGERKLTKLWVYMAVLQAWRKKQKKKKNRVRKKEFFRGEVTERRLRRRQVKGANGPMKERSLKLRNELVT